MLPDGFPRWDRAAPRRNLSHTRFDYANVTLEKRSIADRQETRVPYLLERGRGSVLELSPRAPI
jgi:hypothetical protein